MIRYLRHFISVFVLLLIFISSCQNENILNSQSAVLLEGNWQGQLNGHSLFLTLIEGRFESSPTITGSAHLSLDSFPSSFLVMGGTHNDKDSVWFALYKPATNGKENFQFRARIVTDSLIGLYKEFNDQSLMVDEGLWYTKRIP